MVAQPVEAVFPYSSVNRQKTFMPSHVALAVADVSGVVCPLHSFQTDVPAFLKYHWQLSFEPVATAEKRMVSPALATVLEGPLFTVIPLFKATVAGSE